MVDTLFAGMRTILAAALLALLVVVGMPMAPPAEATPSARAAAAACHSSTGGSGFELEQTHGATAGCSSHDASHSDADHWHGSCVAGLPPAALNVSVAPPQSTVGTPSTVIPDEQHLDSDDRPPRSHH